jgi:Family of unknown function (DUF5681)
MRQKLNNGRPKNYKIGKGRPPVQTRWKRGQSGNPKGRPKGSKKFVTLLAEVLNQKVRIQLDGKTQAITKREAIVLRLVHDAMKGNSKAIGQLLAYEPEVAKHFEEVKKITLGMSLQEAADAYAQMIGETV